MSNEKDPNGLDPHQPGAKLDDGKIMAGLLADFSLALLAVAEVGTFGAKKYTRGGWQSVPNGVMRYGDALWRHLLAERHEAFAEDSGLKHAAHAAWNALARLELILRAEKQEQEQAFVELMKSGNYKLVEKLFPLIYSMKDVSDAVVDRD